MIQKNEFSDKNWGHCLSLKNDLVELTVPLELGPRIIRYSYIGEKNVFGEFPAQKADADKSKWHSYGGHRLWHGPEDILRTYIPDNDPVQLEIAASRVIIRQNIEKQTQLQKEMELHLSESGTHVQVIHRIRNHHLFDVRLAVWGISVMATKGRAILPLPPRGTHNENLQAQTSLTLWKYTNLQDPRYHFGQKYLSFQQDPTIEEAQKFGISRSGGWLAYLNEGNAFIKKCAYGENQTYSDEGSALEIYSDGKVLEMESLSPLTTIKPGEFAELIEDWYLLNGIDLEANENELDQKLALANLF